MPAGREDLTYPQWLNFSSSIIDEWTGRVRAPIANKLPDTILILGDSADVVFHEANNGHRT